MEKDNDGCVPLHCAIRCNEQTRMLRVVQCLVKPKPESVLVPSNNGESPVGLAVGVAAPIEVVRYLVEQCPDKAIRETSSNGMSPLHAAAINDDVQFAKFIVKLWPDSVRVRSATAACRCTSRPNGGAPN